MRWEVKGTIEVWIEVEATSKAEAERFFTERVNPDVNNADPTLPSIEITDHDVQVDETTNLDDDEDDEDQGRFPER